MVISLNSIINLLEKGLDGASLRQKALSNNLANVNTPNYKRKDVNFQGILENEVERAADDNLKLDKTSAKHLSAGGFNKGQSSFKITTADNTSYKNDDNNISVDVEMTKLAKNHLYYNTLTRQINNKFSMIKNVINKGGN